MNNLISPAAFQWPTFAANWELYEYVLFWVAIAIGVVLLIFLIHRFFCLTVKIIKYVIIPLAIITFLFFMVVAFSDTFFNTTWWIDDILPWFQNLFNINI